MGIDDTKCKEVFLMKKWIQSVILAIFILAIICLVFWKINWISTWKEVAILYSILVVVIMISTLAKIVMRKRLG